MYLQDRIEHVMCYRRTQSSETVFMELLSEMGFPKNTLGIAGLNPILCFTSGDPTTIDNPILCSLSGGQMDVAHWNTRIHIHTCPHSKVYLMIASWYGHTLTVAYANFIQKYLLNRCWITPCEVPGLTIKRRETVMNTHISQLPQNVHDIRIIPSRF